MRVSSVEVCLKHRLLTVRPGETAVSEVAHGRVGIPEICLAELCTVDGVILTSVGLPADRYTLTQLRYDVRKMKAHGLLERNGGRYLYRLTDKGTKAARMFVLFHQRVCGPLANSLFHHRPDKIFKPISKIEAP